ncbi:MutS2 family protein [Ammonifex degensii KC4]|uniref:Endonuclease MutS2 n=1 Tax=Ammonifex degensii (strain DSM 10501 / KC4) TaxID=429009 RepID=C9RBR6_AMMDK|nr:endonuclease MutS2 [Ammonifex degensii]ACX51693.1 MutS2 family protein [Ammonifex degensii KC4]
MDARTLKLLDFPAICQMLRRHTTTSLAGEWAEKLKPTCSLARVKRRLEETKAAREFLRHHPGFTLGELGDLRPLLRRVARGGQLSAAELWQVAELLSLGRRVKDFFREKASFSPLKELSRKLVSLPFLEEKLREVLLPPDDLKATASPLLAQIRRRRREVEAAIKEILEEYLRSPNWQRYLQEPLVTVREGRYVLPVKVEHRDKIKGLVHDQSASGATLFVEPWEVVEKGNELRRLEIQEREEKERILGELSSLVRQEVASIYRSFIFLSLLDFVLAKGRLAEEWEAVIPELKERPLLRLKQVRHPLLGRRAVPLDLELGDKFDILVITGPNTGGKTVALKTAGLSVILTQAGLGVPAEAAEIGLFRRVLADIGDEQSVVENLSTFSAHLRNLARFLAEADEESLVLLDELGAGTDPREGAALGCAILEELARRRVKVVATTHLSEIKDFALLHPRVENAAVDFDPETFTPTYRLVLGRPGQSLAFEMARRLGLSPKLVARAKEYLRPEEREARELATLLTRRLAEAEKEREEARRLKEEARMSLERYRLAEARLKEEREKIIQRAREEAAALVRQARREAEALLKELKEQARKEQVQERERAVQKLRERLGALGERYASPLISISPSSTPASFVPGDPVFVPSLGREGTVVAVEGDSLTVQVGAFKLELPAAAVRPVAKKESPGGVAVSTPSARARPVLDLRGQRVEEALENLSRYLDAALLAGLERVTIIHGHGTGALRAAVRDYLSSHPQVKSFRLGTPEEGGAGVTVVELA